MKKRLSFVFALFIVALLVACTPTTALPPTGRPTLMPAPAGQSAEVQILFIGNSHIFTNDLPGMFASLAQSGGHQVKAEHASRGGFLLEQHTRYRYTLDKIDSAGWDYVVLQEAGSVAWVDFAREEEMYPAMRSLDERIRGSGAQTILFMAWANPGQLAAGGLESFSRQQAEVAAGFSTIAKELGALVAPVGIAWEKTLAEEPDLELWQADGVHATRSGTYLAACVFYALVCQESPEGLSYTAGLPEDTARFLQRIAAEAVLAEQGRKLFKSHGQRLVSSRQCKIGLPNAHRARADALLARAVLHYVAAFEMPARRGER